MSSILDTIQSGLNIPWTEAQVLAAQVQREEFFFEMLRQRFRQLGQEKPVVSIDIDDFLYLLEHRIADDLGIDIDRFLYTYSMFDNPKLTPEERQALIAAFADPKYFQDIDFLPGVERILEPQELGAVVRIDSNAFSREGGNSKKEELLAAVPGLKPEQVRITVIEYGQAQQKVFDPNTTITCDDSPFNVSASPAMLGVMPTWMHWSHTSEAKARLKASGKIVTWHDSLNRAIDFVNKAVRAMTR